MTEHHDSAEHHEPVLRLVDPLPDEHADETDATGVETIEDGGAVEPDQPVDQPEQDTERPTEQAPRACEDGCVLEGEHESCVALNPDFFAAPTAEIEAEPEETVAPVEPEPAPRRRPRVKTEFVTRDMDLDATPTFARLADEFNLLILQR